MKSRIPAIVEGMVLAIIGVVLGYVAAAFRWHGPSVSKPETLTPEIVIARCGKPLNNSQFIPGTDERILMYSDLALGEVALIFVPRGNGFDVSMNVSGDGVARRFTYTSTQIAALPCLRNRAN